jgi:hypothetical protein
VYEDYIKATGCLNTIIKMIILQKLPKGHAMNMCWGNGGKVPYIFNLRT